MGRSVPQAAARRCRLRAGRRSRPHPAEGADGVARKRNASPAPLPSQGADVGVTAEFQSAMDGRVPRDPAHRARMAQRRGLRPASPREPAAIARRGPETLPHPPLPRHHAQPPVPISGPGLGRRLRRHRRARRNQSAPIGRGRNLPANRALHHRLPHVLGRLQRRCQQDDLERARLESGRERRRDPARSTRAISSAGSTADSFAHGLLELERNWRGPLAANHGVDATFTHFHELERAATPQMLANWRFQQALYRAYYDAYTRAASRTKQSSSTAPWMPCARRRKKARSRPWRKPSACSARR